MNKENEINFTKIRAEEKDYYSDDDIFNFGSWGADLSFRELIDRFNEGELIKPDLQRYYVWDKLEASRFIDSILLGLPLPSIFLAKTKDEKLLIIDGFQRIMTVYDYVTGIFGPDGKIFRLTDSTKVNARWKGKAFTELNEVEQRKIKNTTIHSIVFSQKKPANNDTGMYQIFERLNTSGRTLLPQEIRNCVYQNTNMNKLLFELNQNPIWRSLFGDVNIDKRMRDMEMILRFFTLFFIYTNPPPQKSISLKKVLNQHMGNSEKNTEDLIVFQKFMFEETIEKIFNIFGSNAFHNIGTKNENEFIPKFNPTIFDSIMIAVVNERGQDIDNKLENLKRRRKELLKSTEYQSYTRIRTTNIENIIGRIDMVRKYMTE